MKENTFYMKGICPSRITVHVNDDKTFEDAIFFGGCPGNHKGINALCKGMPLEDIIPKLEGITCGMRNTSCPNELANCLKYILEHWEGDLNDNN